RRGGRFATALRRRRQTVTTSALPFPVESPAAAGVTSALAPGRSLGLYDTSTFRLTDGRCGDCATLRQALWYFRSETIAVPLPGVPVATFTPAVRAADDVRAWAAARSPAAPLDYPPLVWVAA